MEVMVKARQLTWTGNNSRNLHSVIIWTEAETHH